jgi:hypothetical protein
VKLGNSLPDAVLAGVVSWGDGCAVPGKYGIYMSIDQYVPWMLAKMGGACRGLWSWIGLDCFRRYQEPCSIVIVFVL